MDMSTRAEAKVHAKKQGSQTTEQHEKIELLARLPEITSRMDRGTCKPLDSRQISSHCCLPKQQLDDSDAISDMNEAFICSPATVITEKRHRLQLHHRTSSSRK